MNTSALLEVSHDPNEKLLGLRYFDLIIDECDLERNHQFDFIKEQLCYNGFFFQTISYGRYHSMRLRFSIPNEYCTRSLRKLVTKTARLQEMLLRLLGHIKNHYTVFNLVFIFLSGRECMNTYIRLKFNDLKYPSFYFDSFDVTGVAFGASELIDALAYFKNTLSKIDFMVMVWNFIYDDVLCRFTLKFDIINGFTPKTMNELISITNLLSSKIYKLLSDSEDFLPPSFDDLVFNLK